MRSALPYSSGLGPFSGTIICQSGSLHGGVARSRFWPIAASSSVLLHPTSPSAHSTIVPAAAEGALRQGSGATPSSGDGAVAGGVNGSRRSSAGREEANARLQAGARRRAWGGGRGRGERQGPGRGQAPDGREGAADLYPARGAPADDPADDLTRISDLPTLAAVVDRRAAAWNVGTSRAAFYTLARLSSQRGADPELCRRTLRTLAAAYLPLVPGLPDAFSCVAPLYACAKTGHWEEQLAVAVLERLGQEGGKLMRNANGQNLGNLWWSVSTTMLDDGYSKPALKHIAAVAEGALVASEGYLLKMTSQQLKPQVCSNVLLACARLQRRHNPLLQHLTACLAIHDDVNPQNLANSLYALGELAEDCGHEPRPQHLQRLADRVVERLGRQQQQQLCEEPQQQVAPGGGRQQECKDGGRGARDGFKPQELSNMLLGCAKLYKHCNSAPTHLPPLSAGQAAHLRNGQGSSSSSFIRAVNALAPVVQRLSSEVLRRLQDEPSQFEPQALYNIMWALEGLRPDGVEVLACALAAECRSRKFARFTPQELSNISWALSRIALHRGKLEVVGQGWYDEVVAAARAFPYVSGAKSQDWSNLWHSLALVRHRPRGMLLEAMVADPQGGEGGSSSAGNTAGALTALRTAANLQDCANLLWSLATLGLYEQRLVDVLVERLGVLLGRQDSMDKLIAQNLANSLWALAVMGPAVLSRHSLLVEGLLRDVMRGWEQQGRVVFELLHLAQLWQVQLELVHVGSGEGEGSAKRLRHILAAGAGRWGSLPLAMQDAAREGRLAVIGSTSGLQQAVLDAIRQLRQDSARNRQQQHAAGSSSPSARILSVLPEHPVKALCCRVDVVVELAGGRRVAVEVDGPLHFLANTPHTRAKDGSTQLRDRQLERVFGAGNVVSVPHWEWNKLRGKAAREEYVRRLLGLPQKRAKVIRNPC